ncbi:MAG: hypothetical protein ACRCZ5_05855 [Burkholderiales bacterium]|jgi:hypothetical protein
MNKIDFFSWQISCFNLQQELAASMHLNCQQPTASQTATGGALKHNPNA